MASAAIISSCQADLGFQGSPSVHTPYGLCFLLPLVGFIFFRHPSFREQEDEQCYNTSKEEEPESGIEVIELGLTQ